MGILYLENSTFIPGNNINQFNPLTCLTDFKNCNRQDFFFFRAEKKLTCYHNAASFLCNLHQHFKICIIILFKQVHPLCFSPLVWSWIIFLSVQLPLVLWKKGDLVFLTCLSITSITSFQNLLCRYFSHSEYFIKCVIPLMSFSWLAHSPLALLTILFGLQKYLNKYNRFSYSLLLFYFSYVSNLH